MRLIGGGVQKPTLRKRSSPCRVGGRGSTLALERRPADKRGGGQHGDAADDALLATLLPALTMMAAFALIV